MFSDVEDELLGCRNIIDNAMTLNEADCVISIRASILQLSLFAKTFDTILRVELMRLIGQ